MIEICTVIVSHQTTIIVIPILSHRYFKDITAIMESSSFDSNKELRFILTKYSIPITTSNIFSWNCLSNTNVSRYDLDHLVRVIGLCCENVIIKTTNRNWRNGRNYYCEHCK